MIRYTVQFSKAMDAILTKIAKKRGMSKAGVLRNSLIIYDILLSQIDRSNGENLAVVGASGMVIKIIVIPQ